MENEYLLELIGKSYNQKVKHDAQSFMKEQQLKFFGGHSMPFKETAFIYATKNGEIKSIGASCVNDLFLDNMGLWLAGMLKTPDLLTTTVTLKEDDATLSPVDIYRQAGGFSFNLTPFATGSEFKLGSGSTVAARTDFDIETALATAPENAFFGTTNGQWSSSTGKITVARAIIAGGAGTVNESGLFFKWSIQSGGLRTFMLAHDNISPGVIFTAAQTLTTEYLYTL